jgi:hypothetical protein
MYIFLKHCNCFKEVYLKLPQHNKGVTDFYKKIHWLKWIFKSACKACSNLKYSFNSHFIFAKKFSTLTALIISV